MILCICGLNGSGKTTLAKALARKTGFVHMDAEDYFFSNNDHSYKTSRSREEVKNLLFADMTLYQNFIFSTVNGNMNEQINSKYDLVIYLDVPLEIRMDRIKKRSFDKFGKRMLKGGDMYETEKSFFDFVSGRTSDHIEGWLNTLACPVLRLDGTKEINESLCTVIPYIGKLSCLE